MKEMVGQDAAEASKRWSLRQALAPGVASVRENYRQVLLMQAAAAAIVFWYYRSPSLQIGAEQIARAKQLGGLPMAFAAGAVAGGLLPELAKLLTGKLRRFDRAWLGDTAFNGFLYGWIGVFVDLLYAALARLFGADNDPITILKKLAVDMGLFTTLVSIPFGVYLFALRAAGWNPARMARGLGRHSYRDKVLPAMIPSWAFWIPMLCAVYALPTALQFPFAIVAEASWSLLFVFIARRQN